MYHGQSRHKKQLFQDLRDSPAATWLQPDQRSTFRTGVSGPPIHPTIRFLADSSSKRLHLLPPNSTHIPHACLLARCRCLQGMPRSSRPTLRRNHSGTGQWRRMQRGRLCMSGRLGQQKHAMMISDACQRHQQANAIWCNRVELFSNSNLYALCFNKKQYNFVHDSFGLDQEYSRCKLCHKPTSHHARLAVPAEAL